MSIRIIVNGATGKMGQLAVKNIQSQSDFTLVGETNHSNNLIETIKNTKADVVVDFTNAAVVYENTQSIIKAGARPIIGTSGLLKDQVLQLQKECKKLTLGGIIAPNFSLGAVLMMKYAEEAAKYFNHVEIIELHHDGKLDSPSGTSVRTAEMIANSRKNQPTLKSGKETVPGARGALYEQVPIHAVRLPGLVAHQQVIFGAVGETLKIQHDSIDRQCFMAGVVLACRKVMGLKELVYGLEHIL